MPSHPFGTRVLGISCRGVVKMKERCRIVIVPDVQEIVKMSAKVQEALKNVLRAYWHRAAAAER